MALVLAACVCISAVAAGMWLGKYVYRALLVAGRTSETPDGSSALDSRPATTETWSVLPPGAELWWVQAGAFLDLARAETVMTALQAKGFPASVSSRGPSPVLHRVRVGVFARREAAQVLAQELRLAAFEVYLGELPLNAHPVTISATDRGYLEELAHALEVLGGFVADQCTWWGQGGGWSLGRDQVRAALGVVAPSIRQTHLELAGKQVPGDAAALHQRVTALFEVALRNLSELEAFVERGERSHMVRAMTELMQLVDQYDAFWSSEGAD
jgi:hypothetical protein